MTASSQWLAKGLRPLHVRDYVYESPDGIPIVRKRRFQLMNISDGKDSGQKTFSVQHRSEISVRLRAETWDNEIGPWGEELLYHRPQVETAILSGADIYITEGESDADAVATAWGVASTTHYQGAAGWRAAQAAVLKGFQGLVWIIADNDVIGFQIAWHTFRQLVDVGLHRDQFQFLRPPDGIKDVNEHIKTNGAGCALLAVDDYRVRSIIRKHGELPVWSSNDYYGYGASAGDREFAEALKAYSWRPQRAAEEA